MFARCCPPFVSALCAALAAGVLFASSVQAAAPTVTSFSPTSGKLASTVTVTGTNFATPATVTFDGVASSSVTVNSSTTLTATVPNTADTGKIAVTTSGGTGTGTGTFTVVPGISLTSPFSPGASVTLTYSGFGDYEAVDIYFDTVEFAVGSTSGTGAQSLPVTIPATATPGYHWITAVGRHSGLSAQTSPLVRTDWIQYGFRCNRRGRNAFETLLSTGNAAGLEEAWRTPGIGAVYSSCADVGGVIYATFGDGTVRAFVESTGAQKWSATAGAGVQVYSTPAVVGGIVYVGGGDNYLYAFDANTGTLKWRYLTGGYVFSSPCVKGGIVYFGSDDDYVYALNATTGVLVWKYQTGSSIIGSATIANGLVYVGSYDEKVYALDAASGSLVWTYATSGDVLGTPVVVGGVVYVGSFDDKMYALRASNGVLLWSYTTGGAVRNVAAIANGIVYFGSLDGKEYALEAATGTLVWSFASPTGAAMSQGTCVANGVVYTGDGRDTYVLDASYGGLLTALPVGNDYGNPIVVNGALTDGDTTDGVLIHYTLTGATNDPTSAQPDPARLRRRLR